MELFVAKLVFLAVVLVMAGCQAAPKIQVSNRATASVPYMSLDEFAATLAKEQDVVLVEFCIPAGCFRCDEMRRQIDRLASERREGLIVRRVNLQQQPALAWEFGVTVCPSYVAFRDGKEVFRAAYPTSVDLIASGLDAFLGESSPAQLSIAVR